MDAMRDSLGKDYIVIVVPCFPAAERIVILSPMDSF